MQQERRSTSLFEHPPLEVLMLSTGMHVPLYFGDHWCSSDARQWMTLELVRGGAGTAIKSGDTILIKWVTGCDCL
jgi:hypothetical protein